MCTVVYLFIVIVVVDVLIPIFLAGSAVVDGIVLMEDWFSKAGVYRRAGAVC